MVEVLLWIFGGIFTILWWLLRNKDEIQARAISDLYSKHEKDAKELVDLRVQIAESHYKKDELDSRFERLEAAFKSGFEELGRRFDRLSDRLTDYIERDK